VCGRTPRIIEPQTHAVPALASAESSSQSRLTHHPKNPDQEKLGQENRILTFPLTLLPVRQSSVTDFNVSYVWKEQKLLKPAPTMTCKHCVCQTEDSNSQQAFTTDGIIITQSDTTACRHPARLTADTLLHVYTQYVGVFLILSGKQCLNVRFFPSTLLFQSQFCSSVWTLVQVQTDEWSGWTLGFRHNSRDLWKLLVLWPINETFVSIFVSFHTGEQCYCHKILVEEEKPSERDEEEERGDLTWKCDASTVPVRPGRGIH